MDHQPLSSSSPSRRRRGSKHATFVRQPSVASMSATSGSGSSRRRRSIVDAPLPSNAAEFLPRPPPSLHVSSSSSTTRVPSSTTTRRRRVGTLATLQPILGRGPTPPIDNEMYSTLSGDVSVSNAQLGEYLSALPQYTDESIDLAEEIVTRTKIEQREAELRERRAVATTGSRETSEMVMSVGSETTALQTPPRTAVAVRALGSLSTQSQQTLHRHSPVLDNFILSEAPKFKFQRRHFVPEPPKPLSNKNIKPFVFTRSEDQRRQMRHQPSYVHANIESIRTIQRWVAPTGRAMPSPSRAHQEELFSMARHRHAESCASLGDTRREQMLTSEAQRAERRARLENIESVLQRCCAWRVSIALVSTFVGMHNNFHTQRQRVLTARRLWAVRVLYRNMSKWWQVHKVKRREYCFQLWSGYARMHIVVMRRVRRDAVDKIKSALWESRRSGIYAMRVFLARMRTVQRCTRRFAASRPEKLGMLRLYYDKIERSIVGDNAVYYTHADVRDVLLQEALAVYYLRCRIVSTEWSQWRRHIYAKERKLCMMEAHRQWTALQESCRDVGVEVEDCVPHTACIVLGILPGKDTWAAGRRMCWAPVLPSNAEMRLLVARGRRTTFFRDKIRMGEAPCEEDV
eukprot:PhM_4_TR8249/c0_g1_i1/m.102147